jgi:hypothetical protein
MVQSFLLIILLLFSCRAVVNWPRFIVCVEVTYTMSIANSRATCYDRDFRDKMLLVNEHAYITLKGFPCFNLFL